MFIVPLGVIWAGYALGWYGLAMVKGPGMGFADLIFPSRITKATGIIKAWGSTTAATDSGGSSVTIPSAGTGAASGPGLGAAKEPGLGAAKRPG